MSEDAVRYDEELADRVFKALASRPRPLLSAARMGDRYPYVAAG